MRALIAALVCGAALAPHVAFAQAPVSAIPPHPRELRFAPLDYQPPDPARHRQVLENGVVGYFVEDRELPLVTVTVLIRGGSYLDPEGREGLASLMGSQMRAGGTASLDAEAFDEELAFLAANVGAGFGATSGSASANFLSKDRERALALFFEMLKTPRFQEDRLELARTQRLQGLERRNDSTDAIEGREWARLMRGDRHFSTREPTGDSTSAISRDDLVQLHRRLVHPANFVLAVSGDFETASMRADLERALADWPFQGERAPDVPAPDHTPTPGLYLVHKADVNQGRVSIGHLGIARGHADEVAIEVMNEILGGSGFTSRIMARVRSDEGLAYSAGSSYSPGVYYAGTFRAAFQSRSESCARAARIVLDEVDRMRSAPVAADELDTIKTNLVEVFPRAFQSAGAVASTFASDELTGRDPAHWRTYRDRVRAVTADDVLRVAKAHLDPSAFVILAVGNVDAMLAGEADHPEVSFERLAAGRPMTRIPLPDPVSLIYPRP